MQGCPSGRRRVLAAIGAGGALAVGGASALSAGGTTRDSASLERAIPPTDSISIRPGTEVLFEATVPADVDPLVLEWAVDQEASVRPWHQLYRLYEETTTRAAYAATFDAVGTHEVRASAPGDGESLIWIVDVADGGAEAPAVTAISSEPGKEETVPSDATVTLAATAEDERGELARLVWMEPGNESIVETTALSGEADAGTIDLPADTYWLAVGYGAAATVVTGDGRVAERVHVDGPAVRPAFDVEIVDSNQPVVAGERLVVDAAVRNLADVYLGEGTQDVSLVVGTDPTVEDVETVTVDWGRAKTVSLGYETVPVARDVAFPVRVETLDDADEVDVTVYADDPGFAVTILETNDPVAAGAFLSVMARLENPGEDERTATVDLVVGHDPTVEDSQSVTVDAGEATTIELGYDTVPVPRDVSFPVRVETEGDADERSVSVRGTE